MSRSQPTSTDPIDRVTVWIIATTVVALITITLSAASPVLLSVGAIAIVLSAGLLIATRRSPKALDWIIVAVLGVSSACAVTALLLGVR